MSKALANRATLTTIVDRVRYDHSYFVLHRARATRYRATRALAHFVPTKMLEVTLNSDHCT